MTQETQYSCGHCRDLPKSDPRATAFRNMREDNNNTVYNSISREVEIEGVGTFKVWSTGKWETI